MPFQIVRNDITKMNVDAVVNAANRTLKAGGGVCGAIFAAAGAERLQAECDRIGHCDTGEAVVTDAYNLPASFIIHTAGPVWQGGEAGEERMLKSCYVNSLRLSAEKGCGSVAFPLISSGIYGYPKPAALRIAVSAIREFLQDHDMMVYLTVFDKESALLGETLFTSIGAYIDDHYLDEHTKPVYRTLSQANAPGLLRRFEAPRASESYDIALPAPVAKRSIEDVLGQMEETFSQMLLRLIDEKGMTDVETYKRANMDRKLFSKIRSNPQYNPGKTTALSLAVALKLSLDDTLDLLSRAGYTLSHSSKSDLIVEYFIRENNYNIDEINEALFAFGQPLLSP